MEIRPELNLSRASQPLCALAAQEIRETKSAVRLSGCNGYKTNQKGGLLPECKERLESLGGLAGCRNRH